MNMDQMTYKEFFNCCLLQPYDIIMRSFWKMQAMIQFRDSFSVKAEFFHPKQTAATASGWDLNITVETLTWSCTVVASLVLVLVFP